jgi:hypothetical protein
MFVILSWLAACGPDEATLHRAATAALDTSSISEATLEGSGGAYTFRGTFEGLPCRGSVEVIGKRIRVDPQRCAPERGTDDRALFEALVELGVHDPWVTRLPDGFALTATGCAGAAHTTPFGPLAGELTCGPTTHPILRVPTNTPTASHHFAASTWMMEQLATAGVEGAVLEFDGRLVLFAGTKGGDSCIGSVDIWSAETPELSLSTDTCPGARAPD